MLLAVRELDVPGEIYERKTYPFEFSTVEMPYETYNGVNVRLRYAIRLVLKLNILYVGYFQWCSTFAIANQFKFD